MSNKIIRQHGQIAWIYFNGQKHEHSQNIEMLCQDNVMVWQKNWGNIERI